MGGLLELEASVHRHSSARHRGRGVHDVERARAPAAERLGDALDCELRPSDLFSFSSVNALAGYVAEQRGTVEPPAPEPSRNGTDLFESIAKSEGEPERRPENANADVDDRSIAVVGLSPGVHGVHLHMTGACDAPEFTSAGGHLNPGGHQHGSDNPAGAHLGDLPNVTVGNAGTGTVTATLPGSREAVLAQLFDADGTAIVVHANADDYRTDPSGNSGGRIACGVLTRS